MIAAVCDARLETGWVPGRKAGYHVATSSYILAELVRRLDGRPYPQYVREAIFEPIGMNDSWIGMPPERYRAYGDRIGLLHDTSGAEPVADHFWDTEEGAALCRPAGNGRGPIRELGRLYQMLLNKGEWEGSRILSPQTVEAIVSPHRVGMYDHTFRHVMDWALFFIVNSARYGRDTVPYGFGPHASRPHVRPQRPPVHRRLRRRRQRPGRRAGVQRHAGRGAAPRADAGDPRGDLRRPRAGHDRDDGVTADM